MLGLSLVHSPSDFPCHRQAWPERRQPGCKSRPLVRGNGCQHLGRQARSSETAIHTDMGLSQLGRRRNLGDDDAAAEDGLALFDINVDRVEPAQVNDDAAVVDPEPTRPRVPARLGYKGDVVARGPFDL